MSIQLSPAPYKRPPTAPVSKSWSHHRLHANFAKISEIYLDIRYTSSTTPEWCICR